MSFMSKYLQYLSIVLFGFFVLTYASIIKANEINEHTVEYAIDNFLECKYCNGFNSCKWY